MTNQQFFVLVFTFAIGIFSGAYMYITGYVPNYKDSELIDEEARSGSLVIRGEQFGGCGMVSGVCASFELTSDRKYKYIPAHSLDEVTPQAITGSVSRTVYEDLESTVDSANLKSLQVEGGECKAAFDGIDYKYDLIIDGVSYEMNSCGTAFNGSTLYTELLSIWQVITSTSKNNNISDRL